ncbi:MAG: hypothetical protein ABIF71_12285 [Planctomycetota bacterium]
MPIVPAASIAALAALAGLAACAAAGRHLGIVTGRHLVILERILTWGVLPVLAFQVLIAGGAGEGSVTLLLHMSLIGAAMGCLAFATGLLYLPAVQEIPSRRRAFHYLVTVPGFPVAPIMVIALVFGTTGLVHLLAMAPGFICTRHLLGGLALKGRITPYDLASLAADPLLWMVAAATAWAAAGSTVPAGMERGLLHCGRMALPLGAFILGGHLDFRTRAGGWQWHLLLVTMRQIYYPALVLLLAGIMVRTGHALPAGAYVTGLIVAAMPVPSAAVQRLKDIDHAAAVSAYTLSTAVALVVTPLLIILFAL